MKRVVSVLGGIMAVVSGVGAADVQIDVNLDVQHVLDTVTRFDRNKFVAIHSDVVENEWDEGYGSGAGPNFTSDLRDDFLNGYDVYLGRNTGSITWYINNVITEDANRDGFADSVSLANYASQSKSSYISNASWHSYEARNDQIICAQLHPFYPDGQTTAQGWAFSQTNSESEPFGTATGEAYGRWLARAYGSGGTNGQPKPLYAEVINEPLWHLVDYGSHQPEEVFRFHNAVATQIRRFNHDVQIGGYCTAFPDFELNDFGRWNDRWKLFMDMSGTYMDFWTIHLYDFPSINGGQQMYRKGSNMEATLDMMEQYSYLSFGVVKPIMVSEFGAQMHDYFGAWSPYRDWLHLKSVNSMMMQFMERANIINRAINFLTVKSIWGTTGVNDTYNHRLMRRMDEPVSYTGTWVYSDMVKTYQLWSEVKGLRVDARSQNPDIMTDAYVDGNTVYVILNNLDFVSHDLYVNLNGAGSSLSAVKIRQLYLNGTTDSDAPVLTETIQAQAPDMLTIAPEGTYIVAYTYASTILENDTSDEKKYYAEQMLRPIVANTPMEFTFAGVVTGDQGEATLRLGVGRNHNRSLHPVVTLNGVAIDVPSNFRGDPQTDRSSFFGVLEIPFSYALLQSTNSVQVTFPDDGGHVSSVSMRVYSFSRPIHRTWDVPVSGVSVSPGTIATGVGQRRQLYAQVDPDNASNPIVLWNSDDTGIVTVDEISGEITGISEGGAYVIATTADGGFKDSCQVTVQTELVPVPVDSIQLAPVQLELLIGQTRQMMATLYPSDATNDTLHWLSSMPAVATVNNLGLVNAVAVGETVISVRSDDSNYSRTCSLSVAAPVSASLSFVSTHTSDTLIIGDTMDVQIAYHAGTGNTVVTDGLRVWLRLIENTSSWRVLSSVMPDLIVNATEANGTESGTITVRVPTSSVPLPTSELSTGNFYFLFATLSTSAGGDLNSSQFPIKFKNPVPDDSIPGEDGLTDALYADKIYSYPNPASEMVYLSGIHQSECSIHLYNLMGQELYCDVLYGSCTAQISVADIPEGLYVIAVDENERIQTILLRVEH